MVAHAGGAVDWSDQRDTNGVVRRPGLAVGILAVVLTAAPTTASFAGGSADIPPRTAAGLPNVQSESAIVFDMDTGEVLYEQRPDEIRAIASTGKVFVALTVRKHGLDLEGTTQITREDHQYSRGGAKTRLSVGYTFRNLDLLRAMLIASDNRAPSALGRAVGLSPDQLVAEVNALARELGLAGTFFTDPPGLRGNVSTARELAAAYRVAMRDPLLRGIMGTQRIEIQSVAPRRRAIRYANTNRSLRSLRYQVTGGKTGYNDPARYCLVISALHGGRHVGMVFLGGHYKLTRYGDFNRVISWLEDDMPGGVSHGALGFVASPQP